MPKKASNPDGGSNIRIQMQVSDVASPELYASLLETKVNSRRHRVAYLATLGLLLERSMLNGGMRPVAEGVMQEFATPETRKTKTQPISTQLPSKASSNKIEAASPDVLVIPENFGADLLSDLV